jgi:hypothetical protein
MRSGFSSFSLESLIPSFAASTLLNVQHDCLGSRVARTFRRRPILNIMARFAGDTILPSRAVLALHLYEHIYDLGD